MTKTIKIPQELNEEQQAEFIRQLVRDADGDPDTLYLMDMELPEGAIPFEGSFEVTFNYDHYKS